MQLPVNIEDLVHGNTIEWERLEFKQGWNPEGVIHSMCAFANDLHNWGGGYVIVGVAENNGQPILPPHGVQQNQLDNIQGEIIGLAHQIQPNYFPIIAPYVLEERHILVIWCPAGDNRPYTAPSTLGGGAQRYHYIRAGSRSIVAKEENLRKLQELSARIPFDDRVNNRANIEDLDLGLIREYLQETKSALLEESAGMPFVDLCRTMLLAKGAQEDIRPANVGLLFFSKQPEKFFDRAWIELVWHKDDSGRNFKEHYFKGPLHKQLREALSFIQNNIITEEVIKHSGKAEAERFHNYPFEAVEEVLSNAVYHKSYEQSNPVEIQVFPDRMTILSYPAPMPPVNSEALANQKHIIAREYRNRRIGDFLKELRLTEGRGTGLPTIYKAMEGNGSPAPVFDTDNDTYVLVTLPAKAVDTNGASNRANVLLFNTLNDVVAYGNGASNGASNGARSATAIITDEIHDRVLELLSITTEWIKRDELFSKMSLSNQSANRKKYLDPLIDIGWIQMEYPDSPTDPRQRYSITKAGIRIKKVIGTDETTI